MHPVRHDGEAEVNNDSRTSDAKAIERQVMTHKLRCDECRWFGNEVLVAPHPFTPDEQIYGCPRCMGTDLLACCDEPGCGDGVTCGTPSDIGAALEYVKLKATHLSEAQVAALNALRGADETDDVSRSRLKAASTPTTRDETPVVQCGCAVTTDGLGNPGRLWCATHWLERDADKTKPPHETPAVTGGIQQMTDLQKLAYQSAQSNNVSCPKCGQFYFNHPRLGIYHVCDNPTDQPADKTKPPHEPDGCLDCLRAERSVKTKPPLTINCQHLYIKDYGTPYATCAQCGASERRVYEPSNRD